MTSADLAKGALAGAAFWLLALLCSVVLLAAGGATLGLMSAGGFDAAYLFLADGAGWAGFLLDALVLFGAGFAAAGCVPERGWLAGLAAGVLLVALGLSAALIVHLTGLVSLAFEKVGMVSLVTAAAPFLVFPALGGLGADALASPPRFREIMGYGWGYISLLLGLLGLVSAVLVLSLYSGPYPEIFGGDGGPGSKVAGVGLVMVVLALVAVSGVRVLAGLHGSLRRALLSPVACAIYAWVLLWTGLFLYRDAAARPEQERLQKAVEHMNAENRVPPGKNGAPLYRQAFAALGTSKPPQDTLNASAWAEGGNSRARKWLDENSEAISVALDAAKKPSVYFLRDPQGAGQAGMEPRNLARARRLARALGGEFQRLHLREGRFREAARHLRAVFRLSRGLYRGPQMSILIGNACRQIAVDSALAVLRESGEDADGFRAVLEVLRQESFHPAVTEDQVRLALEYHRRKLPEKIAVVRSKSLTAYLSSLFMPKELVREELRRVTARIAARNTLFGMREEVLSLKEEAQKRLSTRSVRPVHAAARTVITMSLPSWRRTLTALLSFRARLRIVTVSAAARLYRAEKGEKPSRWEDLVPDYLPEVPGDPVKKKAKLQLTHRDGSLVIYSVGKDGEDNGGRGTLYEEEEDTPFGPVEPDRPDDMALSLW